MIKVFSLLFLICSSACIRVLTQGNPNPSEYLDINQISTLKDGITYFSQTSMDN